MLAKAIALAAQEHEGQKDKAGMPYVLHVLKVMHYLKTDDQELMQIAVMHDLLEDTSITAKYMLSVGFSMRVVSGVIAVTKWPNQEPEEYLADIKANPDAVRVKLADLRHNMDPRRLKGLTEKDFARMQKYQQMYWELKECM